MLFGLDFDNNTIFSCFFSFFLITDLYFFIPSVITQILNPIAKLVIPIGISSKKAESEIHPVTADAEIGKCYTI